jgi:alginate O-acetyltransferase complex protein AlgI
MLFNSFTYILFLWTCYVLFWTWRERKPLRHTMLLVASYVFYGWVHPMWCVLLMWSTLIDYVSALQIQRGHDEDDPRRRKLWMGMSLVTNIGLLAMFKYFDFFSKNVEEALGQLGVDAHTWRLDLFLPAGISFYTFQTLSYTIDVYRGSMRATRSLLDFAVFVAFFPQLVAGPIVRATDFIPQLEQPPKFRMEQVCSGLFQILRGLTKKLLMADILGAHLVDRAFLDEYSVRALGAPGLAIATYGYALQLYGDFAGYSDIAIGSARLMGFELLKNFDAPFRSRSLEEFWTRWHISMSTWFTDYVYIGMGGSRRGLLRACWNAFFAWTLVGLWHGAAWTFVLWGMYHGMWLVIARLVRRVLPNGRFPDTPLMALAGGLFTFHVVAFSMIIFRCRDMGVFRAALDALGDWSAPLPRLSWQIWTIMALGYFTHLMPGRWVDATERRFIRSPALVQGLLLAVAIVVFYGLRPPGLTPFVYFQF